MVSIFAQQRPPCRFGLRRQIGVCSDLLKKNIETHKVKVEIFNGP